MVAAFVCSSSLYHLHTYGREFGAKLRQKQEHEQASDEKPLALLKVVLRANGLKQNALGLGKKLMILPPHQTEAKQPACQTQSTVRRSSRNHQSGKKRLPQMRLGCL